MFSRYYKAVIAAVSIIGASVSQFAADPSISGVLPANVTQWLTMAGSTVVGTWLVWLVRNEPTVSEATELLERAKSRVQ